jgi:hypothetical protein
MGREDESFILFLLEAKDGGTNSDKNSFLKVRILNKDIIIITCIG